MYQYGFIFFILGSWLGAYFHAFISIAIAALCGCDLITLVIFNKRIIHSNGKTDVSDHHFTAYPVSSFMRAGTDAKTITLINTAIFIAEILISIFLIFFTFIAAHSTAMMYLMNAFVGILFFCISFYIKDTMTLVSKNKSIDGRVRYLLKELQSGKDINDLEVSLADASILKKPDSMRFVYYALCFEKMLYNENYDAMPPLMSKFEEYASGKYISSMQKEHSCFFIFHYYSLPEFAALPESPKKAEYWFTEWAKLAKKPYDSDENLAVACYHYYILHDAPAARDYLAQAEIGTKTYAGTEFEKKLNTVMIEKLKAQLDQ